jgi:hypothetical protein
MEVWCYSKISGIDCVFKTCNNLKVGIRPRALVGKDPRSTFSRVSVKLASNFAIDWTISHSKEQYSQVLGSIPLLVCVGIGMNELMSYRVIFEKAN